MPNALFNRSRVRAHRDRSAPQFADFLFREAAERLADRLDDITRRFPVALDLGAHNGVLASALKNRGGIETLVQSDLSPALLREAAGTRVVCDEEFLPFAPESFDAIFSVGSLHWVNDLPGALIQIQRALKPDGLFLAVLPGPNTLKEFRQAALFAATQENLPMAPMLSPQVEVRDAGALLQRAGSAAGGGQRIRDRDLRTSLQAVCRSAGHGRDQRADAAASVFYDTA